MTEYTPDEQAQLNAAAQAGAELRQMDGAFDKIRSDMLELIAKSAMGESVLREKLYLGVSVLDQVRTLLFTMADGVTVIDSNALIRKLMDEGEG